MTESVIDFPKDELCPEIWEKVVDVSGMKEVWQLKPDVRQQIQSVFEHIVDTTKQHFNIIHITGSITSNSYTENADIDMHLLTDKYEVDETRAEEINKAIRAAYQKVFIGKHPIEVYFQPNKFQDFMSVGCYDFFNSKWLVGPELTDQSFNPYSEYYAEIQKKSEALAQQIRNMVFSIYEIAVVYKKNLGTEFASSIRPILLSKLSEVQELYDSMRQMRKVYSSPESEEQAIQFRNSRKWKVADASFKLFDKYGYTAILKQFIEDAKLLASSDAIDEEVVEDILNTVKKYINNADKLAEEEIYEELTEDDNFNHDSKSYFKYWQQSSSKNTYASLHSELAQMFDDRMQKVFGNSIEKLLDIIDYWIYEIGVKDFGGSSFSCHLEPKHMKKLQLNKIANRKLWWDLIPDHTYKAIVSREAAVQKGELSRGVSDKVIYDCLDKICWNTAVLYVQSRELEKVMSNSKFYQLIQQALDSYRSHDGKTISETVGKIEKKFKDAIQWSIWETYYSACATYLDDSNGKRDSDGYYNADEPFYRYETTEDNALEKVFDTLNEIKYDDPREKLIAGISKAIDHYHYMGSLAGAFIEGGSKTCDQVSNRKANEPYESEQLDEGPLQNIALASLLAIPNILPAKTIQRSMDTQPNYSYIVNDINAQCKMIGQYTSFQAANIIARTLFAEARNDGEEGMRAVASVIYNRANGKVTDFANVCKKCSYSAKAKRDIYQFSCWNKMNRSEFDPKNFKVKLPKSVKSNSKEQKLWEKAMEIVGEMLSNSFMPTINATAYYNPTVVTPSWKKDLTDSKNIGSHIFGYLTKHSTFI